MQELKTLITDSNSRENIRSLWEAVATYFDQAENIKKLDGNDYEEFLDKFNALYQALRKAPGGILSTDDAGELPAILKETFGDYSLEGSTKAKLITVSAKLLDSPADEKEKAEKIKLANFLVRFAFEAGVKNNLKDDDEDLMFDIPEDVKFQEVDFYPIDMKEHVEEKSPTNSSNEKNVKEAAKDDFAFLKTSPNADEFKKSWLELGSYFNSPENVKKFDENPWEFFGKLHALYEAVKDEYDAAAAERNEQKLAWGFDDISKLMEALEKEYGVIYKPNPEIFKKFTTFTESLQDYMPYLSVESKEREVSLGAFFVQCINNFAVVAFEENPALTAKKVSLQKDAIDELDDFLNDFSADGSLSAQSVSQRKNVSLLPPLTAKEFGEKYVIELISRENKWQSFITALENIEKDPVTVIYKLHTLVMAVEKMQGGDATVTAEMLTKIFGQIPQEQAAKLNYYAQCVNKAYEFRFSDEKAKAEIKFPVKKICSIAKNFSGKTEKEQQSVRDNLAKVDKQKLDKSVYKFLDAEKEYTKGQAEKIHPDRLVDYILENPQYASALFKKRDNILQTNFRKTLTSFDRVQRLIFEGDLEVLQEMKAANLLGSSHLRKRIGVQNSMKLKEMLNARIETIQQRHEVLRKPWQELVEKIQTQYNSDYGSYLEKQLRNIHPEQLPDKKAREEFAQEVIDYLKRNDNLINYTDHTAICAKSNCQILVGELKLFPAKAAVVATKLVIAKTVVEEKDAPKEKINRRRQILDAARSFINSFTKETNPPKTREENFKQWFNLADLIKVEYSQEYGEYLQKSIERACQDFGGAGGGFQLPGGNIPSEFLGEIAKHFENNDKIDFATHEQISKALHISPPLGTNRGNFPFARNDLVEQKQQEVSAEKPKPAVSLKKILKKLDVDIQSSADYKTKQKAV